jgi:hypothetical protein
VCALDRPIPNNQVYNVTSKTSFLLRCVCGFDVQMERRERLRKLLAEREAAGEGAPDGAPLIGQVCYCYVVLQQSNTIQKDSCSASSVIACCIMEDA